MSVKIQLKRNESLFTSKDEAMRKLQEQLSTAQAGEIIIATYDATPQYDFNKLPEGVSIVDGKGEIHVGPYDTYSSDLGLTGIGVVGPYEDRQLRFIMAPARTAYTDATYKPGRYLIHPNLSKESELCNPQFDDCKSLTKIFIDMYKKGVEDAQETSVEDNWDDCIWKELESYSAGVLAVGKWCMPSIVYLRTMYSQKEQINQVLSLLSYGPLDPSVMLKYEALSCQCISGTRFETGTWDMRDDSAGIANPTARYRISAYFVSIP